MKSLHTPEDRLYNLYRVNYEAHRTLRRLKELMAAKHMNKIIRDQLWKIADSVVILDRLEQPQITGDSNEKIDQEGADSSA